MIGEVGTGGSGVDTSSFVCVLVEFNGTVSWALDSLELKQEIGNNERIITIKTKLIFVWIKILYKPIILVIKTKWIFY